MQLSSADSHRRTRLGVSNLRLSLRIFSHRSFGGGRLFVPWKSAASGNLEPEPPLPRNLFRSYLNHPFGESGQLPSPPYQQNFPLNFVWQRTDRTPSHSHGDHVSSCSLYRMFQKSITDCIVHLYALLITEWNQHSHSYLSVLLEYSFCLLFSVRAFGSDAHVSHRKHRISITKTRENHTKHRNALCEQNAKSRWCI
jgi:hypothetical protein